MVFKKPGGRGREREDIAGQRRSEIPGYEDGDRYGRYAGCGIYLVGTAI